MGNKPGKIIKEELSKNRPNYNKIDENKKLLTKKEFNSIVIEELQNYNINLLKYLEKTGQLNDLFCVENRIMSIPLITYAIIKCLFVFDRPGRKEFKEFLYSKSDINQLDRYFGPRSLYNNNTKY